MFTALLAHDLRSPLSAILASAHLLQRRSSEPAALEAAARIVTSGNRMARMIEDMLDLARARLGGGILVKREATDLKALVERVLREHQTAAPDQPIEAAFEGTFTGHWDSERVAQVASNLIGNAFKHGSPAAPVEVRLDGTRGDSVVLVVKNAGTIPPDILPHLFDPFRGGQRQPGRGEGLGLGLYIVSQIVQAHNGAVDVQTGDGDETAFYVRLPRGDP
jgi:signal transduction histidine kinase